MTSDNPHVYTVPEVADMLRVSTGRCYELIRRGELPFIRLGRQVRIPKARFHLWLSGDAPSQ
jgi:putative molybdopterin biosynthesis protein